MPHLPPLLPTPLLSTPLLSTPLLSTPLLSTLLLPVCGLLLLGGSLVFQAGTAAPQAVMDTGPAQMAPASVNQVRLTILRRQYRFYEVCRREQPMYCQLQHARNRGLVRQAVALYNQAAAETDPSAFDHTDLPRRLFCEERDYSNSSGR